MKLTHAQCLGLWALASEMGKGTEFEIDPLSVDNYGHVIVTAHPEEADPYHPRARRFKLLATGGREALEEPAPMADVAEEGKSAPE